MAASMENKIPSLCADFMRFQELIKTQRTNDDKIINLLNSTLPSIESFKKGVDFGQKCVQIQKDLEESHRTREEEIKKCITFHAKEVERLKVLKENADSMENARETRQLGNAQRKLRVLQSEIGVEEIVQGRTTKALHERCREYF